MQLRAGRQGGDDAVGEAGGGGAGMRRIDGRWESGRGTAWGGRDEQRVDVGVVALVVDMVGVSITL